MQLFSVIPQPLGKTSSPTFTGLTLSGLTATRVLFAGAGGVISDDAGLVYASGTGTLTATILNATDEDNILQVDGTTILKIGASGNENLFLGAGVFDNDEGTENIGIGVNAGQFNTTTGGGIRNVYIGKNAGKGASAGTPNSGQQNVGIGAGALERNTSGDSNVGIGRSALTNNTTGAFNMAFGQSAMRDNQAGMSNVAIGSAALREVTSSFNVAIGTGAMVDSVAASWNVAIGTTALGRNITGDKNIAIGYLAGLNETGDANIFLGHRAAMNQTTNSNLLIIDNQDRGSIAAELTDCLIYGVFSATPASQSLRFNIGTTTWHNATHEDSDGGRKSQLNFKGQQSGGEETTLARIEVGHDGSADDQKGYLDIFINDGDDGDSPTKILRIDSTGLFTDRWLVSDTNTFLGINVAGSGNLDTGGLWNTATGSITLEDITTGPGNTVTGYGSGSNITEGGYNSGNGYNTLFNTTLGYYNTAMGHLAGYTNTIGNGSVFLGRGAGYWETGSDKLFIDNSTRTNEADGRVKALIYGVFDAAVANQSLTINGLISGSYGAKIGDGGTTNYLNVDSGGRVLLVGTAQTWEDIRIIPGAFQFPGVADPTLESWQPGGAGATFKVYKFKINDEVHFTCQIPHNYKEGSDLKPHLHWTPCDRGNEEDGNTVGWKIDYSWANYDTTFTSSATIDLSDACSGIDDQHEKTDSGTITGTNKTISGVLQIRLYRSDTGADDTWVGVTAALSPAILEFDLHYEIDSLGSDLELVKDAP